MHGSLEVLNLVHDYSHVYIIRYARGEGYVW